MQGEHFLRQVGEERWKMLPYRNQILEEETQFLEYLMDMKINKKIYRNLSFKVCLENICGDPQVPKKLQIGKIQIGS